MNKGRGRGGKGKGGEGGRGGHQRHPWQHVLSAVVKVEVTPEVQRRKRGRGNK